MKLCTEVEVLAVDDDGVVTNCRVRSTNLVDDGHSEADHQPLGHPLPLRPGDVLWFINAVAIRPVPPFRLTDPEQLP